MKRKIDAVAVAAGILFALSFVLSVSVFLKETLSRQDGGVPNDLVLCLIGAKPLFSLAGAIVCFFRLRGVPAVIVCAVGAVGFTYQCALLLLGIPLIIFAFMEYLLFAFFCSAGAAGCIYLAILTMQKPSSAARRILDRILAVLSAVGVAAGQMMFYLMVLAYYELSYGVYYLFGLRPGAEAAVTRMSTYLILEFLIPSALLAAGTVLFSLWLTKREKPASEAVGAVEAPVIEPVEVPTEA